MKLNLLLLLERGHSHAKPSSYVIKVTLCAWTSTKRSLVATRAAKGALGGGGGTLQLVASRKVQSQLVARQKNSRGFRFVFLAISRPNPGLGISGSVQ